MFLARGVDIEKVDFVLNYDAPSTQTLSIHRMGRSGRIHQKGKVLTFLCFGKFLYGRAKEVGLTTRGR